MNDTEKVIAEIIRESLHAVVAERDKYRDALRDDTEMAEQTVETLQNLRDNWRRIVDETDDDGGPLLENILYWLIQDTKDGISIARAALRDDTVLAGSVAPEIPRCECSMRSGSTRTRPPVCRDCGSEVALSVPSGDAEEERYVVSGERLEEIEAMLDADHPVHGVDTYRLAGAVYDLLAEREGRS